MLLKIFLKIYFNEMKAILRTNDFTEDFKVVEVLKNPVNYKINLARVKYEDEIFLTGGFLVPLDGLLLSILSGLSNEEQWNLLLLCKFPMIFD